MLLTKYFQWYPTEEDLLDVNFQSIVSDLRGIIRGTLVPRSWYDISCSWSIPNSSIPDIPKQYKLRGSGYRTYYKSGSRGRLVKEKKVKEKRIYEKPVRVKEFRPRARELKMIRIFEANGLSWDEARIKTTELLNSLNGRK